MKYFRTYPWGLQLLLFVLMVLTMSSLCSFCVLLLLPKLAGIQFTQLAHITESSPFVLIKTSLTIQGIFSIFMFMVPSLLFAYFTHPEPFKYLGLRKPAKGFHLFLSVCLILGAMPVLIKIEELVSHIDFGPGAKATQTEGENMMKAYLSASTPVDFIRTFIVMAIIPACGEELFFRGSLMKFAFKGTKGRWMSILFSSVVFAAVHSNPYGLFSIFLAGVLLAVIYYMTSSLWCCIAAHLSFNGAQIVLSYLAKRNIAVDTFVSNDHIPLWLLISGVVVFCGALFLLLNTMTPLPPSWADDFDPPLQEDIMA